ncbi:hypothetical protein GQ42DRAFT_159903 [Ramicandelaber brevisporus]|nr:hypothetical protein GQ42DRAFT_159903 [Ramicandelaber brevisporus]
MCVGIWTKYNCEHTSTRYLTCEHGSPDGPCDRVRRESSPYKIISSKCDICLQFEHLCSETLMFKIACSHCKVI